LQGGIHCKSTADVLLIYVDATQFVQLVSVLQG